MMPLPDHVWQEISRHEVGAFKVLPLDHDAVTMAAAFLMHNGMEEMARHLRLLAQEGRLRQGGLEGFVASAVIVRDAEYILLSHAYPEYNTVPEMMASLVQEIGAVAPFNCPTSENELRANKSLEWLATRRPALATASMISVAAHKVVPSKPF